MTIWPSDVLKARALMRAGLSMHRAAGELGILSSDLDKALWQHIATSDEDLTPAGRSYHPPMFED